MTTSPATAATSPDTDPAACLAPAICVDSDHPAVAAYAASHVRDGQSPVEQAVAFYYAVRDDFIYDPYSVELTEAGMKASAVLSRGSGMCISKATLLAACCRAVGIPARLGFADVRNHLATKKFLDKLGSDLFVYHAFAELFLDGNWVKATPAFNLSLCEKFGVLPLEFDGRSDSVFHPFDASGRRHMEYVTDRGVRADVPVQEIRACFAEVYPGWTLDSTETRSADTFECEAEAELRRPG